MSGVWHILVYDEACELCERLARWMKRFDSHHRLTTMTFGEAKSTDVLNRVPEPRRWTQFHLVSPSGEVTSGDAAIPALLRLLPGGAPLAWLLVHAPGGQWAIEQFYRWLTTQHK